MAIYCRNVDCHENYWKMTITYVRWCHYFTPQVTLATSLGKPMIPLLMEKMAWPPEGSMGPIFGEYLFVRFFQRPAEATGDSRYWPADKFSELLMQLSYSVVPDGTLVKGGKTLYIT